MLSPSLCASEWRSERCAYIYTFFLEIFMAYFYRMVIESKKSVTLKWQWVRINALCNTFHQNTQAIFDLAYNTRIRLHQNLNTVAMVLCVEMVLREAWGESQAPPLPWTSTNYSPENAARKGYTLFNMAFTKQFFETMEIQCWFGGRGIALAGEGLGNQT